MIHGVTDIYPIMLENKSTIQEKLPSVLIQFGCSGSSPPPVCGLQGFELCGSPVKERVKLAQVN